MTRHRRTRILVEGSAELRKELSDEVNARYEVQILEPSDGGLVMIEMREPARGSRFFLGEMLVTEARVRVSGAIGLGIIAGDEPDAALQLAVIDAAFNAGLPELFEWTERLLEEERRLEAVRRSHTMRLMETKVDFQTMDVD